jgi:hypothetical protein
LSLLGGLNGLVLHLPFLFRKDSIVIEDRRVTTQSYTSRNGILWLAFDLLFRFFSIRLNVPLGPVVFPEYFLSFLRLGRLLKLVPIFLDNVVGVRHVVLPRIRNIGSLPDLLESCLLNPGLYCVEVVKVTLVFHYSIHYVLLLYIVAYRVILCHCSQVNIEPRNQGSVSESVELNVFVGIET